MASTQELDMLCRALVDDRIVDRVVPVDDDPARRSEVVGRYFEDPDRVPAYAHTGGPIYATLLGLESARCDHVVQFDCDMFFHASGGSWVAAALRVLEDDPTAWLAMTHGGPPLGKIGTPASLGAMNARRPTWDPGKDVWRFSTASTRYFLADRRRLRGRLRVVPANGGCAPLEMCISEALKRHGTSRVSVELAGSWDLHPYSHEPPFPDWAAEIAAAVERGDFPRCQRGQYDLRLDRSRDRAAWAQLLQTPLRESDARTPKRRVVRASRRPTPSGPRPARRRPPPAAPPTVVAPRPNIAPLAVVIPTRDRAGDRLHRCLASLQYQTAGAPLQTIVVSHGSAPKICAELRSLCAAHQASLIEIGSTRDPWCKPLALNVGIRATDPALAFVMPMDADMILAPNFLEVALAKLREHPRRMVLCRSSDLPRRQRFPPLPKLPTEFAALHRRAKLRSEHGCGGVQAAPRSFFFEVHGYDEDLIWWGAEDRDMLQRATGFGLEPTWITEETAMLHQWHVVRHRDKPAERREIDAAVQRNHDLWRERAEVLVRNLDGWGVERRAGTTDSATTNASDVAGIKPRSCTRQLGT